MRDYCGPAATIQVKADRFGTFRATEMAPVLYQEPGLTIEWNQIDLCGLGSEGFEGFGKVFEATPREDLSDSAVFSDAFAGLGRMRTVPRWTLNELVVEADAAIGCE